MANKAYVISLTNNTPSNMIENLHTSIRNNRKDAEKQLMITFCQLLICTGMYDVLEGINSKEFSWIDKFFDDDNIGLYRSCENSYVNPKIDSEKIAENLYNWFNNNNAISDLIKIYQDYDMEFIEEHNGVTRNISPNDNIDISKLTAITYYTENGSSTTTCINSTENIS